MKLTPAQCEMLPSDDDVRSYREHGYYVSKKILSDEEIDDAIYGSDRYYAGERDFLLSSSVKAFEGWKPEDGDILRINDYASLENSELSALVRNPLLAAIAAKLCGTTSIRLWHDQMIYKPKERPGLKTSIGWHTDRAYWKTCTSSSMLTAWIPFHDCPEEMGTLLVVDGSHKWSSTAGLRGFHSGEMEQLEREFAAEGKPIVKTALRLEKGQVSFHHCLTIHGSGPNRSDTARRSMSVHFQDASNQYRELKHENGERIWHRNDMLCRVVGGQPDYSDPDFCPTLYMN